MKQPPAERFTDLLIWQKAHGFVLRVYAATRAFPREELYGLTSQFRRAATSVPANIAEGFRKRSRPDKMRLLNISEGSLDECRYYAILAHDLGYEIDKDRLLQDADEIGRMLHAYTQAIRHDAS